MFIILVLTTSTGVEIKALAKPAVADAPKNEANPSPTYGTSIDDRWPALRVAAEGSEHGGGVAQHRCIFGRAQQANEGFRRAVCDDRRAVLL